ncbi:MAG: hypothetical protein K8T26_19820 [Lentisphaerae bacterium]|nr:hypothetical protein [Lentisphaerota bacterium]
MGLFEVLLGVDYAARDTGRRITMCVRERDPFEAARTAEAMADETLDRPDVEYTHAISVKPVSVPVVALAMAA